MMDINSIEVLNSNVGMDCETRTNKTIKDYLKRGIQMWRRASKELLVDLSKMTPNIYLVWLEQQLPKLMPPSRRQYIAATRCFLEVLTQQATDEYERQELMSSLQYANRMKSEAYHPAEPLQKKWRGATSSQKSKHFSDNEFNLFLIEIKKVKWKWGVFAAIWIAANRLVGLRPSEWRTASLIEGSRIILEVNNGKQGNDRANGELRHIDVTDLQKGEIDLIKRQLTFVKKFAKEDENWDDYYDGVRQVIYRIVRRVNNNRRKFPSLYSTRHQFAADAKSSGMSLAQVAALMGHASDRTASSHYGKKKHGRNGSRVKPDVNEVATVLIKVSKNLHSSMKV